MKLLRKHLQKRTTPVLQEMCDPRRHRHRLFGIKRQDVWSPLPGKQLDGGAKSVDEPDPPNRKTNLIGNGRCFLFISFRNPNICDCGEPCVQRMSWTDTNPGRRLMAFIRFLEFLKRGITKRICRRRRRGRQQGERPLGTDMRNQEEFIVGSPVESMRASAPVPDNHGDSDEGTKSGALQDEALVQQEIYNEHCRKMLCESDIEHGLEIPATVNSLIYQNNLISDTSSLMVRITEFTLECQVRARNCNRGWGVPQDKDH
ncbi:hypothetical protein F8388_018150 [Cannabis sativa]|uniref:Uncharacterized protein n=1 Tax=Cannabis sativa TaxID=3483 RepID=A0A7J6GAQ3_CANSA|nr:hypothetical protein F8388_018150 [Cannabis sativa]